MARLEHAVVNACALEIPVEDFTLLPQELECTVQRSEVDIVLMGAQPGCAMHFRVNGSWAELERIDIHDDSQGLFFRDVVGLVFQLYSGDLDAELLWFPRGAMDEHVKIRAGETKHPLLFQSTDAREAPADEVVLTPVDFSLPLVEQWLNDAHLAWEEYQRLKSVVLDA